MRPELDVGAKESGADQRGLHRIPSTLPMFRNDKLKLPALSVGNSVRQCLLDGPPLLARADQDDERAVIGVETGPCGQRKARLLVRVLSAGWRPQLGPLPSRQTLSAARVHAIC